LFVVLTHCDMSSRVDLSIPCQPVFTLYP